VSDPVTGNRHDTGKLSDSVSEKILKAAGGVFGDKGFTGTDYITTPVRKPEHRELYIREKDYNNQISPYRAPVERAVAQLKTWRMLFTDYRRPLETFRDVLRRGDWTLLFQADLRISLLISGTPAY
jgi:DDE superfamily endonuclease